MNVGIGGKYWLHRHYWWILAVLAIVACIWLVNANQPLASVLAVLGAIGSAFYFIQKQNLEELVLFRKIFRECNERYDRMNQELASMCKRGDVALSQEQKALLTDYFNLCGEEYLYYRRGLIDPRVWKAWRNGMLYYLRDRYIREFWDTETATDSYYGLEL